LYGMNMEHRAKSQMKQFILQRKIRPGSFPVHRGDMEVKLVDKKIEKTDAFAEFKRSGSKKDFDYAAYYDLFHPEINRRIKECEDLRDRFIAEDAAGVATKRYDKIAFINELLKYLIKYYPEKGIFFFDLDQLNEIDYVNITFCNCDMSESLCSVSHELFKKFLQDEVEKIPYIEIFMNEASELEISELNLDIKNFCRQTIQNDSVIRNKIKQIIMKKIQNNIGRQITKTCFSQTTKLISSKLIGNLLLPGIVESCEMIKQNQDSTKNIQKNIRLYLKNYNFEKTLGFAFDYNNLTNQLEIFSLEQKGLSTGLYANFIDKINILDSTHMLISFLQPKTKGKPNMNLNIYGSKVKVNLNSND
ncbi:MAG: hypothetical protein Q8869_00415, partial [Candidatus Phytoplasma australasiaticum]|nr:hypothetical protein [Candidatus Phytoplasma australasiaticum]